MLCLESAMFFRLKKSGERLTFPLIYANPKAWVKTLF